MGTGDLLKRELRCGYSAIHTQSRKFAEGLKNDDCEITATGQLVFLCGANDVDGQPSPRRVAVKKFIEEGLPGENRVIYAEAVFHELLANGPQKNVLDVEHEISQIADRIIIILESPSAVCELGAFSHKASRKKLMVINDAKFKGQNSFINIGPIKAIGHHRAVKSRVYWYRMSDREANVCDGIGSTFSSLGNEINKQGRSIAKSKDKIGFSTGSANKISLYMIHDLVFFAGPISHSEIIEVLKVMFDGQRYDIIRELLGVLKAAGFISRDGAVEGGVYRSLIKKQLLNYTHDVLGLMTAFRYFHLRNHPSRFSYV